MVHKNRSSSLSSVGNERNTNPLITTRIKNSYGSSKTDSQNTNQSCKSQEKSNQNNSADQNKSTSEKNNQNAESSRSSSSSEFVPTLTILERKKLDEQLRNVKLSIT